MSHVTRREWYERANAAWPTPVPPLTAEEAVRAARKLYRFVRGRTYRGTVKVTSGNRRAASLRHGLLSVNPKRGWHDFVHSLSHWLDWYERGADSGHDAVHARLERRMIHEVVRRGWLDGRLKTEPKPVVARDLKAERQARVLAAITRWEQKRKRAERALARLRRKQRYYERESQRHGDNGTTGHDSEAHSTAA